MRKRLTAVALAGTVGLGAMGAVAYPALADSTTKESPQAGTQALQKVVQERKATAIREALEGLVDDKTLTTEQADKVAETLSKSAVGPRGPGGMGMGKGGGMRGGGLLGVEGPAADEAAAKVLGMTVEDLRAALRDGSTLAELAKKQGKDVDALVSALVTAAKARLAEGVEAGKITQETATQIEKTLEQRVRTVVQHGRPAPGLMGRMHGEGGPGQRPWQTPGEKGQSERPTPGPSPSATGSANSSSFDTA